MHGGGEFLNPVNHEAFSDSPVPASIDPATELSYYTGRLSGSSSGSRKESSISIILQERRYCKILASVTPKPVNRFVALEASPPFSGMESSATNRLRKANWVQKGLC